LSKWVSICRDGRRNTGVQLWVQKKTPIQVANEKPGVKNREISDAGYHYSGL